ncbi:MAG TPA: integron integrase [Mizugakiibacter sp.]|nr:integron integrase [Mizugakiibacter sp.]
MPKLLDQLRERLHTLHYSPRTEATYVDWVRRFMLFHSERHPVEMGAAEVEAFLSHLAVVGRVSASTQNQAKSALLFLYRQVLAVKLPWLDGVTNAQHDEHLLVVLTKREVGQILMRMSGINALLARLLYGTGMRLMEGVRLRVQDVNFVGCQIVVRESRGNKDRVTMLPNSLAEALATHLAELKTQHERDLAQGAGEVYLPPTLARKYPNAGHEWGWQYVFPAVKRSTDPRSGVQRRHHLDEKGVQRAMKRAVRNAGITKAATPHTLRHSFATHLLQSGYDICTVQELLGHKHVETTMRYMHALNKSRRGALSPLDG